MAPRRLIPYANENPQALGCSAQALCIARGLTRLSMNRAAAAALGLMVAAFTLTPGSE